MYDLRTHAAAHFSHVADPKDREHDAEVDLVRTYFGKEFAGTYVEVGANDPRKFSQTYTMEQHGWTGLLIEPIAELCQRLKDARPKSTVVRAACGSTNGSAELFVSDDPAHSTLRRDLLDYQSVVQRTETVPLRTLDAIFAEQKLKRIDFISIDVEGLQLEVLKGLSLDQHRPRLLLIEDHLTSFETHRYITSRGYVLAKRTGLNNWYIPAGTPFTLTSAGERFKLWGKLLRTPFRAFQASMRRRRAA